MIVHRSNRIEALVDALAELVALPLPDPFAPEWIAVQGRGMERWLAMELAQRLGIWANPSFPFPRRVIEAAITSVLGAPPPATSVFDPRTLRWAIAEALPQHLGRAPFAPIRRYLDDDPRGAKLLQLGGRIADLFDQYAVYRPEMVLEWERGDGVDWQAELWRSLVRAHGAEHAAARSRQLLAALAARQVPGPNFPRRLSLFGLSTLPPLYVEILAALSRSIELHLFVLSPSREYWADVRARRHMSSLARQVSVEEGHDESANEVEGHPLLASLGRVGRDFQAVLESAVDYRDDDRYAEPGTDSVLAALQSDMLALRVRGPDAGAERPLDFPAGDRSLAVHACHSPMREVEVLHDQLLSLLDQDATLSAAEIVVMTPSIDAYAPLIAAVFGSGGRPAIPFRIADRRARAEHEVVDAFLRALELLRGRLPASAVLDLLALEPVRDQFGIAAEELDRLRGWVADSGVRWGADAAHRAEQGQPSCDDNTWRFGLERLLLGHAMPGDGERLFAGMLPYDDVEGSETALLGRCAQFIETLGRWRRALSEARHPAAWRDLLGELRAALLANTAVTAFQHQAIGAALDQLAERATTAGYRGTVDLDGITRLLEAELEYGGSARGFLSGGVTFCELVPMRTIPFRVVCLLGMNDGTFPRARRPLGFDLIAARPRRGDRTARDDDRYLFLEALLAAREQLIVTYVGQSISDNSELPPSVVVNELLDAVDRTFAPSATAGAAREHILQRHALQPFSPRYFGRDPEQRAFSYATTHYRGAVALDAPRGPVTPWLAAPLPAAPLERLTLDELTRFFDNPSRWFLRERLAIYLGSELELLEDREPLELDALERWRLGDAMLSHAVRGGRAEDLWLPLRAGGTLPLGALGRGAFDAIAPLVETLAREVCAARGGERLPREEIDVVIDGVHLTGELDQLWPGGQIAAQYSRLGGRQELRWWIRHLVRQAARGTVAATLIFGRIDDKHASVRFESPPDPLPVIRDLLRLFRLGQEVPLPFFSRASREFAQKLAKDPPGAAAAAREVFVSADGFAISDSTDAYVAELYPDGLPLDGTPALPAGISFAEAARTVFEPMLRHRTQR